MNPRRSGTLPLLCLVAVLGACSASHEDASQALAEIEQAAVGIAADAKRYAPDSYARYDAQLASLKTALDQGDYGAVVQGSQKLRAAFAEVQGATIANKASFVAQQSKLQQRWNKLDSDLGAIQSALEKRLRMLADSQQLPQNFDRGTLERVGASFARHRQSRVDAQTLAKSGDFSQALLRGAQIEAGYTAIMREVGLAPAE